VAAPLVAALLAAALLAAALLVTAPLLAALLVTAPLVTAPAAGSLTAAPPAPNSAAPATMAAAGSATRTSRLAVDALNPRICCPSHAPRRQAAACWRSYQPGVPDPGKDARQRGGDEIPLAGAGRAEIGRRLDASQLAAELA
jgi:hypothetical protein